MDALICHMVHKVLPSEALAYKAPLLIGEGNDHRVDFTGRDKRLKRDAVQNWAGHGDLRGELAPLGSV